MESDKYKTNNNTTTTTTTTTTHNNNNTMNFIITIKRLSYRSKIRETHFGPTLKTERRLSLLPLTSGSDVNTTLTVTMPCFNQTEIHNVILHIVHTNGDH